MSKTLSIDDILDIDDAVIERVETPQWGGHIFVRSISGDKRDEIDQFYSRGSNGELNLVGVRAHVVGACMCDESGKFVNPTQNQLRALGKKSGAMLDKAFDVCQRINGMRRSDVEELEKNLTAEDANGSG